jgi:hypothetical protein
LISTFLFQVIKALEKTVVVIQNGYPETKAILATRDRTKANKPNTTTHKTKNMSNMDLTKNS